MAYIYNSRNYRSLLALTQSARFSIPISTIVEIIEAYQPCISVNLRDKIYNSRNYRSLLALVYKNISFVYIYNSRNYRSLLAKDSKNTAGNYLQQQKLQKLTSLSILAQVTTSSSTIVEIIEAYQPLASGLLLHQQSTIVEIIEAYQPKSSDRLQYLYLQQQKLQKLTSRLPLRLQTACNLQQQKLQKLTSLTKKARNTQASTIVEIIEAYQPSLLVFSRRTIYNSRNYRSLLASQLPLSICANLQQQKLQKLTSLISVNRSL